jgi:hypothetical protein
MLKEVVSGRGAWRVKVGKVYCSVGTPLLRVHGLKPGDRLKVTVTFTARSKKAGRGAGARFRLEPTGPLQALAAVDGTFEGSVGWQSVRLVGFYLVGQGPEGVSFDVLFSNGSDGSKAPLDGRGRIRDFLMSAELV